MNITERVKAIIDAQREKGFAKYGQGVEDAELSPVEWIQNAQEEAADFMVYLEALKRGLLASPYLTMAIQNSFDPRTTAQIERELLGEVLNRLTSLQLNSIQTIGGLSFVDIIQEIENMIEETKE